MNSTRQRKWETVNRIVFPVKDATQILPLYAIDWQPQLLDESLIDIAQKRKNIDFQHLSTPQMQKLVQGAIQRDIAPVSAEQFEVADRRTCTVHQKGHISLCTYFNAFPASYWKRWTNVEAIRFECSLQGEGELAVMRSNGRGLAVKVAGKLVNTQKEAQNYSVEIPMTNLIDGGFFWIDAFAGENTSLTISNAKWQAPIEENIPVKSSGKQSRFSIAITTFNRPTYCFDQLDSLANSPDLRMRLDTIYCIDQGTSLVSDEEGFNNLAVNLGTQLTYIKQKNLGGSGGFARGMFEAVHAAESTSVLLLDDDAINEPEAILRAVQFSDYTVQPTIVGAGMLHLDNRTVLYTQGERIDPQTVWMKASQGLEYNHDFSAQSLRDTPELHQRVDSDFNGWWMCLIPVSIIREIGLPIPVFIKFDDTEYSLRAKEHGYSTVCLPGVAVWHQAWHDKDPARTWEQYFMQRNRWITALLHHPEPNLRFIEEMIRSDLNLGLRLIYSGIALDHRGLRDILRGPEYIVSILDSALNKAKGLREKFPDAQTEATSRHFPEAQSEFISRVIPRSALSRRINGIKNVLKSFSKNQDGIHDETPQITVPAQSSTWESFEDVSSALLTSADGNSVAWVRRNTPLFRKAMRESVHLSLYLYKHWEELSITYRNYPLSDFATWETLFKR